MHTVRANHVYLRLGEGKNTYTSFYLNCMKIGVCFICLIFILSGLQMPACRVSAACGLRFCLRTIWPQSCRSRRFTAASRQTSPWRRRSTSSASGPQDPACAGESSSQVWVEHLKLRREAETECIRLIKTDKQRFKSEFKVCKSSVKLETFL